MRFLESEHFSLLLLSIVVLIISIMRWRLIGIPLERDEGEYAYFGQLILKGIPLYLQAYSMKLPGIYYMYALIMKLFGESYTGIHMGFIFLNAGTMVLLYLSLKKFFSAPIAIITAGVYGLVGMSKYVLGFAAHATHFAVFFLALFLFFFSKYCNHKKAHFALFSGMAIGMSFLMKQQAVYFILFASMIFIVFEYLSDPKNIRGIVKNTGLFSVGVFVPYCAVLIIVISSGAFDKFWFWTVQYAGTYTSGQSWAEGTAMFKATFAPLWKENRIIWCLSIIGVVLLFLKQFSIRQKMLALGLAFFGCAATTPGFYFRHHYFIVVLPAVGLLVGISLDFIARFVSSKVKLPWLASILSIGILLLVMNRTFSKSEGYYATRDPLALGKAIYIDNPVIESLEIAKYIEANSADTDKVAVIGSEPQIVFYAHRQSATGYLYMYELMKTHEYALRMQDEMIAEIEKNKPLFIVFCSSPLSWLSKSDSPMKILDWSQNYSAEKYLLVGLIDIPDQGISKTYWNADANRQPETKNFVWIFKRKDQL
jgi:4-amino-4-deoxy-L-arabinose transferase-like glycosyltransferase